MDNRINLEKRPDGIAIITFDRPQALNALNLAAMQQFADVVRDLSIDEDLRVVVLTGAGTRAFCSGGDLIELSERPTEADALEFITLMGDALLMLERLPVPVIAAINGYALGGGSEIAVACDMRIIDRKARLGFVQLRLALTPGWGAGQRLLRLVGYTRAFDILLHGHVLHAPEARRLGLANKIVEEGTALDHAIYLAKHIAENPPGVIRGIKTLLRAGLERPYEDALQVERSIFPPLWADQPHLDAVEAFLQKNREREQQKQQERED